MKPERWERSLSVMNVIFGRHLVYFSANTGTSMSHISLAKTACYNLWYDKKYFKHYGHFKLILTGLIPILELHMAFINQPFCPNMKFFLRSTENIVLLLGQKRAVRIILGSAFVFRFIFLPPLPPPPPPSKKKEENPYLIFRHLNYVIR